MNTVLSMHKKPIKLVYVIDHLGVGGAQRQLTELIRALPKDKFDIEVIVLSEEKVEHANVLEEAKVPLTLVPHAGKFSWNTFWTLHRKLRKTKPDLVHTWLFTADLYGRLAARTAGVRRVVSAMRSTIDDLPWHHRRVVQLLSCITTRITINAEYIRSGLVGVLGIPSEKVRTIYNGIDLSTFPSARWNGHYRREWHIPERGHVVTMIARMSVEKDYRTFLEAAQKVTQEISDVYFVLVGDGPMRSDVERWIRELGLGEKTRVLGVRQDVRELLPHTDVCVLATDYEGCSNVIMEAMAASRPVVATNVGGNAELIVEGKTGYLVPPKDSDALAGAIVKLLADIRKAKAMGIEARGRVEKRFALDRMVRNTEALYREVLSL